MRVTHGVEFRMSSGQRSRVAEQVVIDSCIWLVISGFLVCEGLMSVSNKVDDVSHSKVPKLAPIDWSGE